MAKNGSEWAARIKGEVQKSIIGQDVVIERLLVALLSNGHVLFISSSCRCFNCRIGLCGYQKAILLLCFLYSIFY